MLSVPLYAGPMSWLPVALVTALLYGAQNAMSRAATKGLSSELGAIVLQATAALAVLGYSLVRGKSLHGDGRSIAWAVGAGVAISAGTVLFYSLLRRGAGLSAMGPVVLAGTAVVTAVSGLVFFHEKLSPSRGIGLVLATAAIVLLSRE